MFKTQRAVQVAAYFLWKAQKPLEDIKLMKLMYFSEREYLLSHGSLLTGNDFFFKKKGPVLANTDEAFNSFEINSDWNAWLSRSIHLPTSDRNFLSLQKRFVVKKTSIT